MTTKATIKEEHEEGTLVHLLPSQIEPHPAIKYLEERGIFPYKESEIDKIVESASQRGFIQPITVISSNGRFYRVVGRRRVKAAERLGTTIPCYVRHFETDEDVIEAWKTENFVRASYTVLQQIQETENIKKIWSERTAKRVENVKKCSAAISNLVKANILHHRADEKLIEALSSWPDELQEAIASKLQASKTVPTYKEKIKEVVLDETLKQQLDEKNQQLAKMQDELVKAQSTLSKLENRIAELEDALANNSKNDEAIENMRQIMEQNKKILTEEIKKKEAEIARLEKERLSVYSDMAEKIKSISEKQANFVTQITEKFRNDTLESLKSIDRELVLVEASNDNKGFFLTFLDLLSKTKNIIVTEIDAIDKKVRNILLSLENNNKNNNDNNIY